MFVEKRAGTGEYPSMVRSKASWIIFTRDLPTMAGGNNLSDVIHGT